MANSRGNKRHVNRTVKKHSKTSKRRPSRIGKRKSRSEGGLGTFSTTPQPIDPEFKKFKEERLKWLPETGLTKMFIKKDFSYEKRNKSVIRALIAARYIMREKSEKYSYLNFVGNKTSNIDSTNLFKLPLSELINSTKQKLQITDLQNAVNSQKFDAADNKESPDQFEDLMQKNTNLSMMYLHTLNFKSDVSGKEPPLLNMTIMSIIYYPKNPTSTTNCISKYVDTYVCVCIHIHMYTHTYISTYPGRSPIDM
jgi:hypothetical protein